MNEVRVPIFGTSAALRILNCEVLTHISILELYF